MDRAAEGRDGEAELSREQAGGLAAHLVGEMWGEMGRYTGGIGEIWGR